MRSREKNKEKDIKTNKIKMNTDIVKPNTGELTKAKKTLEKAKELNRKKRK